MSFSAAEKNSSSSDSVGMILFSTVDLRRELAGVGRAVDSSSLDGVVSLLREKCPHTTRKILIENLMYIHSNVGVIYYDLKPKKIKLKQTVWDHSFFFFFFFENLNSKNQ